MATERLGERQNDKEDEADLQPSVESHGIVSGSKALWVDERQYEIDAECQRHGQAKDRFKHGRPSDLRNQARVKRKDAEGQKTRGEEDDVRHLRTSRLMVHGARTLGGSA
jgi:hypothetical protein